MAHLIQLCYWSPCTCVFWDFQSVLPWVGKRNRLTGCSRECFINKTDIRGNLTGIIIKYIRIVFIMKHVKLTIHHFAHVLFFCSGARNEAWNRKLVRATCVNQQPLKTSKSTECNMSENHLLVDFSVPDSNGVFLGEYRVI